MEKLLAELESLDIPSLRRVLDAAARLIQAKQDAYKEAVLAEAKAKLEAAGISMDARAVLPNSKQPRAAIRKAQHTYKHPDIEKPWSGRGNTPKEWLAVIPEGMGRDEKMKVLAQYKIDV